MIPPFPVYLFDIDGTLLDSQHDICGAVQHVLASRGRPGVPHEVLRRYIGRHLYEEFLELGCDEQDIEAMIDQYRAIYPTRKHSATSRYPGIAEALAQLGGRKSTATTKGTPTACAVLEQFGLLTHFDHVQGTDGFPAKPAPDVIHKALQGLNAQPEHCLFVGDSPSDMEAGRKAGVRICAVTWGYGEAEEMRGWAPDFWAHSPHDLLPSG